MSALIALAVAASAPMPICPYHLPHDTCVHDGDTFWLAGERIRLLGVDAPEIDRRCRTDQRRAGAARDRLALLLGVAPLDVERSGHDAFGRTLATVRNGAGIDVGAELIAEHLAQVWKPGPHPRCKGKANKPA